MKFYSPIYLRRAFNIRNERLMRHIFGPRFRTWIKLYIRAYGGYISADKMNDMYARWLAMHRKQIDDAQAENAPSVFQG